MLLRNKKTGEIKKMWKDNICLSFSDCNKVYYSIAELNADWEDYAPKEPLIKQEKIRKAVRAWAEANEISQAKFDRNTSGFSASDAGHNFLSMISFDGFVFNCEDGKYYSIDELCGEEEE